MSHCFCQVNVENKRFINQFIQRIQRNQHYIATIAMESIYVVMSIYSSIYLSQLSKVQQVQQFIRTDIVDGRVDDIKKKIVHQLNLLQLKRKMEYPCTIF